MKKLLFVSVIGFLTINISLAYELDNSKLFLDNPQSIVEEVPVESLNDEPNDSFFKNHNSLLTVKEPFVENNIMHLEASPSGDDSITDDEIEELEKPVDSNKDKKSKNKIKNKSQKKNKKKKTKKISTEMIMATV